MEPQFGEFFAGIELKIMGDPVTLDRWRWKLRGSLLLRLCPAGSTQQHHDEWTEHRQSLSFSAGVWMRPQQRGRNYPQSRRIPGTPGVFGCGQRGNSRLRQAAGL